MADDEAFAHLQATLLEVAGGSGDNPPTGTERMRAALTLYEVEGGDEVSFEHLVATLRKVADGSGDNPPTGTERMCAALALWEIETAQEGTVPTGKLRKLINSNAN